MNPLMCPERWSLLVLRIHLHHIQQLLWSYSCLWSQNLTVQHFDIVTSTGFRLSNHISLIIILPSAYLCAKQEMYAKSNTHTVPHSRNHCCRGKAISIAYSDCLFVALLFHHAKRMHHIFIFGPPLPYFLTLSYKRRDFWEKNTLNMKCVGWFPLQRLSEVLFILRRFQRKFIINVYWSSCKVLSDCNYTWIFSTDIPNILEYQIS